MKAIFLALTFLLVAGLAHAQSQSVGVDCGEYGSFNVGPHMTPKFVGDNTYLFIPLNNDLSDWLVQVYPGHVTYYNTFTSHFECTRSN
jgi:hypothetical protein